MTVMDVRRLIPGTRLDMVDVVNSRGEDLGQVQNFMVDPDTGRIAFMVVSFGGVLGLTDKWIAIPMEILHWDQSSRHFLLDIPRETLENAPGIDKDRWPYEVDITWLDSVYTCFGCRPYWSSDAHWMAKGETAVGTFIISADWLKNREVRNASGIEIGKIDDLVIDLQSGYMTYALLDITAYDLLKGRRTAVPIEGFTVSEDGKLVTLNIDRAMLEHGPSYEPDHIILDRDAVGNVYTYYGYVPYWDNRRIWRRRGTPVHMMEPVTAYRPDLYIVSDLIGDPVHDILGKEVGRLDDLMIDLESGYLASAILAAGGILGVGNKYYPLPLEVLSFDPVKKMFYLAVDRDTIMEAPAFDKDRLPRLDRQGLVDIYAAYGYTPYWREAYRTESV